MGILRHNIANTDYRPVQTNGFDIDNWRKHFKHEDPSEGDPIHVEAFGMDREAGRRQHWKYVVDTFYSVVILSR